MYALLFAALLVSWLLISTFQSLESVQCINHQNELPLPLALSNAIYSIYENVIYLIGGWPWTNTTNNRMSVYKWDLNMQNSWFTSIVPNPVDKFYAYSTNALLINDTIYCIGYYDGSWSSGNIYRFHIPSETWVNSTYLSKPYFPSMAGCATANTTHLFLIDGWDGNEIERPIYLQIYDIHMDQWSLHELDIKGGTTTTGFRDQFCSIANNYLYIFGGSYDDTYNQRIYKYHVDSQQLTDIGEVLGRHSNGRTVYYKNLIYLVAGINIYVFNVNNESLLTATLSLTDNEYLVDAAAVIIDDFLYVFGGIDEYNNLYSKVQICNLTEFVSIYSSSPSPAPTTNPTTLPTTYPSISPSNFPSSHPTANPSNEIEGLDVTLSSTSPPTSNDNTMLPTVISIKYPTVNTETQYHAQYPTNGITMTTVSSLTMSTNVSKHVYINNNINNKGFLNTLFSDRFSLILSVIIVCLMIMIIFVLCIFGVTCLLRKQGSVMKDIAANLKSEDDGTTTAVEINPNIAPNVSSGNSVGVESIEITSGDLKDIREDDNNSKKSYENEGIAMTVEGDNDDESAKRYNMDMKVILEKAETKNTDDRTVNINFMLQEQTHGELAVFAPTINSDV